MFKMPPELKNLYIFSLSFSKDIKGKQLTVNFNNLTIQYYNPKFALKIRKKVLIMQEKSFAIHNKNSQKGLNNA